MARQNKTERGREMNNNPILTGFHADPCICKKENDYYLAVSSFEWFPGVPVYHSKDLKNWELITNILSDETSLDLRKLPSAKGIWAPCLTYDEETDLFYLVYGVMNSMNGRYFDVDNYLITAPEITGPWSKPEYIHSSGFDASMFHDEDGRKYIVSLEWETRDDYTKPGKIVLCEYDSEKGVIGYPKPISEGSTKRGCIEAPHIYKRNGWYYLMIAEGGTGYYHSVTMARAENIWGPYESDPENPIITDVEENHDERMDTDHLKPHYFNPESYLQKSGHGSIIETQNGETFLFHLCSRPFLPELRCTLGRETAMQRMEWNEDGWLRLFGGGKLAKKELPEVNLPEARCPKMIEQDDFDEEELGLFYYAPRISPKSFTNLTERKGYLRIRGQESACSLNQFSLIARKLTSTYMSAECKMDFKPTHYQHSAGLMIYYDNMNYVFLRKYYSETLKSQALIVTQFENGVRTEYKDSRTAVSDNEIYLRLEIRGRNSRFSWSMDGENYDSIAGNFDTSKYSDEYCKFGEFTGAFVGIVCVDSLFHREYADFDYFNLCQLEEPDNWQQDLFVSH